MSISEIASKALINTALGMGTVFVMLIFICFVIYLFKFVGGSKPKEAVAESAVDNIDLVDDTQLVAVIMAAIKAYNEGNEMPQEAGTEYVVRSIKRRKN